MTRGRDPNGDFPAPRRWSSPHMCGGARPALGLSQITTDDLAIARSWRIAAVSLIALVIGPDSPVWLVGWLVAAATFQLMLSRWAAGRSTFAVQVLADIVVLYAIAVAAPAMWPACMIWVGASVAISATMLPVRTAAGVAVVAVVGTVATGAFADIDHWPVTAMCQVSVASIVLVTGSLLRREVSLSEAELMETMSAAGAIVTYVDLEHEHVVRSFGDTDRITGYSIDEWRRLDRMSTIHPDDLDGFWIDSQSPVPDGPFERLVRFRHANGTWMWVRDVSRVDVDRAGRRTLRGLFFDVTALETSRRHLATQARTDIVTGLPNRVALTELIELRIRQGAPFALTLTDLDRFKEINDTLGHEAGDRVLEILGARLRAALGPGDHLARLGGDEFAIVFDGAIEEGDVTSRLDALADACALPITARGVRLAMSMSTGVAFSTATTDGATLLRHADIAMYEAKRHHQSYRLFDDSLEHTSTMALSLSAALPEALVDGGIRMHFQPQFDLESGRLVGAEALIRWHHSTGVVLTPDVFLEMALLSESAMALAECSIEQTAAMLADAASLGHTIPIAVNLAARSMLDEGFVSSVERALRRHAVDPGMLTVEITESDALPSSREVLRRLDQLAALGVHVSVDDFGTGHSSLARLRELHVDELKIDREFVERICECERDRHVVRSVIDLAARLECRVVAEGVEHTEQAILLAEMGCLTGQGYLFAKAMPACEFRRLLLDHAPLDVPRPGAHVR